VASVLGRASPACATGDTGVGYAGADRAPSGDRPSRPARDQAEGWRAWHGQALPLAPWRLRPRHEGPAAPAVSATATV